ncbi:MAG: type II toxin-antitoxin system VapB family antitoxin [Terriglobia bacterium]
MVISIENPETERLALQVAQETGEPVELAIQRSLQRRLDQLPQRRRAGLVKEKLEEILRRVDALPTLDDRPEDEILGYDREGLPR